MAATAGITLPYSIRAIFVLFFECMRSHLGSGITNVGLQMLNCVWFCAIPKHHRKQINSVKSKPLGGQLTSPLWLIKLPSNVLHNKSFGKLHHPVEIKHHLHQYHERRSPLHNPHQIDSVKGVLALVRPVVKSFLSKITAIPLIKGTPQDENELQPKNFIFFCQNRHHRVIFRWPI